MNDTNEERDLLVLEVMALAYAVDRLTEFAVFIDYSGHVGSCRVEIARSKCLYQERLASTEFYVSGRYQEDGLGWLKAKRDHLRSIAETHDIDTSAMEVLAATTFEAAF